MAITFSCLFVGRKRLPMAVNMIVYHGSYAEIKAPSIDFGRTNLDFGKGFYVTTLKEQAEKWAKCRYRDEKNITGLPINPIVNIYEFDAENLNIIYFEGYTEQWLDFVVQNRMKTVSKKHDYDAVFGNVADDDARKWIQRCPRDKRFGGTFPRGNWT